MYQSTYNRGSRKTRKTKGDRQCFLEEIMSLTSQTFLRKEIDTRVREAQRVPKSTNPHQDVIKTAKVRERTLKAAREKQSVTRQAL